jgi:uncharacterized metal-binding protein
VGCAAGLVLTPDLDVKGTRADALIRRQGLAPALLWGLLWAPYSALIPHRSILSHGLILGTVLRLVYVAAPLAVLGLLPRPGPLLARGVVGLMISDNLHVGADWIVSGIKEIYGVWKTKLLGRRDDRKNHRQSGGK